MNIILLCQWGQLDCGKYYGFWIVMTKNYDVIKYKEEIYNTAQDFIDYVAKTFSKNQYLQWDNITVDIPNREINFIGRDLRK